MREGLSLKRLKGAWEWVKETLEYLHLTEFLLHLSHSDALALLVLGFTRPPGWMVVGLLAILGLVWWNTRKEVLVVQSHDNEEKRELPSSAAESGELTIPAPTVPQNLADLAKQGIGVKITIELSPS